MTCTVYKAFGQTKKLPLVVYYKNQPIESMWYTETLWVERPEDWYALMSDKLKNQRVRVIDRDIWLKAKEINTNDKNY